MKFNFKIDTFEFFWFCVMIVAILVFLLLPKIPPQDLSAKLPPKSHIKPKPTPTPWVNKPGQTLPSTIYEIRDVMPGTLKRGI